MTTPTGSPRTEKHNDNYSGINNGLYWSPLIVKGMELAYEYHEIAISYAPYALIVAGAAYAGNEVYKERSEMVEEYDEVALKNLEAITHPSDFKGVKIDKFRFETEKVLKRLKERDPVRYNNFKYHYRAVVRMVVDPLTEDPSWTRTGSAAARPFQHKYHQDSEAWSHGVRKTKNAVKGFVRTHILRDVRYNAEEREQKYQRSREREIRQEYEIPRSPPRQGRTRSASEDFGTEETAPNSARGPAPAVNYGSQPPTPNSGRGRTPSEDYSTRGRTPSEDNGSYPAQTDSTRGHRRRPSEELHESVPSYAPAMPASYAPIEAINKKSGWCSVM